jgi:hypothetical protein
MMMPSSSTSQKTPAPSTTFVRGDSYFRCMKNITTSDAFTIATARATTMLSWPRLT